MGLEGLDRGGEGGGRGGGGGEGRGGGGGRVRLGRVEGGVFYTLRYSL